MVRTTFLIGCAERYAKQSNTTGRMVVFVRSPEQKRQLRRLAHALRSGDYAKGVGTLMLVEEDDTILRCVLGVGCEISHLGEWREQQAIYRPAGVRLMYYVGPQDHSYSLLPPSVSEYYGLSHDEQQTLTGANDGGTSFADLAALIDEWLDLEEGKAVEV